MKRSYDSCRFGFKRCFVHYNYVANLQGSDMAMILVDLNIGQIYFWWTVRVHLLDVLAWHMAICWRIRVQCVPVVLNVLFF